MDIELEVGDLLLCTVDRIVGTNVFVKIPIQNKEIEGSIVTSEIAPGRIRNLRDYVIPKKKIVCKILRISGDRIELSLRRVTKQEQKDVRDQEDQEKSYERIIRSITGERSSDIIKKIKEKQSVYDFLQESKENPNKIEGLMGKEDSKKIIEILKSQRQKKAVLKKEIFVTTIEPNGIEIIKSFLKKLGGIEVKYLSPGRYSLRRESEDIKKADHQLLEKLSELEKGAKSKGIEFNIQKK